MPVCCELPAGLMNIDETGFIDGNFCVFYSLKDGLAGNPKVTREL
jgi:hypothetical protein